jgi:thiamine biosynthesis protein ThiS
VDEMTSPSNADISITLNGKLRSTRIGIRVSDLLEELDLRERLVVVERNGAIVRRDAFADTLLEDGDVLEIVHFVGGG